MPAPPPGSANTTFGALKVTEILLLILGWHYGTTTKVGVERGAIRGRRSFARRFWFFVINGFGPGKVAYENAG